MGNKPPPSKTEQGKLDRIIRPPKRIKRLGGSEMIAAVCGKPVDIVSGLGHSPLRYYLPKVSKFDTLRK
jgi:hypothetical protein